MPTTPTRVRFHSRPPELGASVGGVVRVTNLTPAQEAKLVKFITEQLGGQRYTS